MLREDGFTYAFPILIGHVSILQGEVNLLLQFCRKLIVTIDHVRITSALLDEVGNLCRRHASPGHVRTTGQVSIRNLPMLVYPAGVLLDGDLCSKAKLALLNFRTCLLALGIFAASASILGFLCVKSGFAKVARHEIRNARVVTYPRGTA